ncbi:hypothetical protein [Amycolatopsis sp. NPDC059657]
MKCAACGSTALDQGFVMDSGEGSGGYSRWIAGPLKRGILGGAKLMGKTRHPIAAFACRQCHFLNSYVVREDEW